ncbi:MAG: hypothetical protein GC159_10310 [Phycisphaera sp.]|nr:hypothetical protein [Phycisphaera sp.]
MYYKRIHHEQLPAMSVRDAYCDAPRETNWSDLPLCDLMDRIVGVHHVYLSHAMPHVRGLLIEETVRDGQRYAHLHDLLETYETLHGAIVAHIRRAEHVLFPLLRQTSRSSAGSGFSAAELEARLDEARRSHARILGNVDAIQTMTCGFSPPSRCGESYQQSLDELALVCATVEDMIHEEELILRRAEAIEPHRAAV